MEQQQVERRTISMYPRQWQVAENYAMREGYSLSLAIRKIVDGWATESLQASAPNHEPALNAETEAA